MKFEWHPAKAESNLSKHGVSFDEASTVFDDFMQMHHDDDIHSIGEQRFICIGMSDQSRLLMVVYLEKPENLIRIISAREATRREANDYESQRDFT